MSDIFHFFQPSSSISGAGGQNTTPGKNQKHDSFRPKTATLSPLR
ncbi:hypothetical protein [Pectobacterium polaris]|nr:hypothetical protein [Pectobacterium polaris]